MTTTSAQPTRPLTQIAVYCQLYGRPLRPRQAIRGTLIDYRCPDVDECRWRRNARRAGHPNAAPRQDGAR